MPQVSIITPCYNSERFIGATLQSVSAQTLRDWEHVVVDDGSTDGSVKVVQELAKHEPRLRLLQQSNGGVSKARNTGFYAASPPSQYLLFLDADDCLEATMLEQMSSYLQQHPEVGLLHCGYSYINESGGSLTEAESGLRFSRGYVPTRFGIRLVQFDEKKTPFCSIFTSTTLMPSMCMIRRSLLEEVGGFDEDFGHIYEETDVFLRVALRSEVHFLPQALVRYRRHAAQATAAGRTEAIACQERKLLAKWENPPGLTAEQQMVLRQAHWFRHQRLGPILGLKTAVKHLQQRQWRLAARFGLGAVRRYRAVQPKSGFELQKGRVTET